MNVIQIIVAVVTGVMVAAAVLVISAFVCYCAKNDKLLKRFKK